jgi:hypothetical protein
MASSRRPSLRPLTGAAGLAALALLVAGCGGTDDEAAGPTNLGTRPTSVEADAAESTSAPEPSPEETSDAVTSTAAPDPSDTTGTPPPPAAAPSGDDGQWDDDPRVEIVREWAEEYARAATAGDPDLEDWLDTMTGEAREDRMALIETDLGWHYPGPVPFTVTQVVDRDNGRAAVEACVLARGFAADPATGAPPEDELVYPFEFHLEATDDDRDDYVITGIYLGNQSCNGIDIERSAW